MQLLKELYSCSQLALKLEAQQGEGSECTGALDKPRSGATRCWRAINSCSSSQTGVSPALTPGSEVSFLLQQWEMEEAGLAGATLGSTGTCWMQPGCNPSDPQ